MAAEAAAKIDYSSLNDAIVMMRPHVAKAKVHVISKLTRQMAQLKKRHAKTPAEKETNERKVQRLAKEVDFIKAVKRDTLTKFALKSTKDLNGLQTSKPDNIKVLEERAKIRISTSDAVGSKVKEFREKYPNWETEVQKLLPALGARSSRKSKGVLKKKVEKVRAKKLEYIMKRKGLEITEENKEKLLQEIREKKKDKPVKAKKKKKVEEADDKDSDEDESGDEDLEDELGDIDPDDEIESDENDEEEKSDEEASEREDEKAFVDSSKAALKQTGNKTKLKKEVVKKEEEIVLDKRKGEMEIKTLKMEDGEESEEEADDFFQATKVVAKSVKPKSSFFVGCSDEEVEPEDENAEDVHTRKVDKNKKKTNSSDLMTESLSGNKGQGKNRRERRQEMRENGHQKPNGYSDRAKYGHQRPNSHGERPHNGPQRSNGDNKLHPSWQAKRNMNESSRFSGRKTKFEENSSSQREEPKLHPSWAAKRNMNTQPKAQFEGRKIKFDDDEGGHFQNQEPKFNSRPPPQNQEPKLHPSWQAKRNQSENAAKFSGKKIKFGDGDDSPVVPQAQPVRSNGSWSQANNNRSQGSDEPKLHPSWAAKKKQQMVPSQGTKIKFD